VTLLKIITKIGGAYELVASVDISNMAREEWASWLTEIGRDENQLLDLQGFSDTYNRRPVRLIIKMEDISSMFSAEE